MKKEALNAHLFNFEDLKSQAEDYLASVKKKAGEILEQTIREANVKRDEILEEANTIRQNAHEEGFRAGVRQGLEEAEALIQENVRQRLDNEIEPAVQFAEKGMQELFRRCLSLREELSRNWERAFLQLICRISQVVIRQELEKDPQISIRWIREALELCSGENTLVLVMNPEDARNLGASLERLRGEFRQLGQIEIKADPQMDRGDCILKTENGRLDQRLATQLARIEEELRS